MVGRAVVALLGCAVAAVTACTGSGASGGPASATSPASSPERPDHVVVVVLENKDSTDVLDQAPYLASLAATGTRLTDMHAETHPSQPNYLALFSGSTQGVEDDGCPVSFDGPSLGGALLAAGYTFAGYSEDLSEAGFTGCRSGGYARKHSPWTDFRDVPASANQPLSAMPTDFATLPTVSFVVPNLCHDMHDCDVATGDAWLRDHLDGYARWATTHNSLLLGTFDESESNDDTDNHIATFAVGQRVVPGTITERADHYRLLRTLEDLYGLPPLGHSADTTALTGLWDPSA